MFRLQTLKIFTQKSPSEESLVDDDLNIENTRIRHAPGFFCQCRDSRTLNPSRQILIDSTIVLDIHISKRESLDERNEIRHFS
jgi:hypothetical protein